MSATSERTIVVTYDPESNDVRARRSPGHAREDAAALRRAADVIDHWADVDEKRP